MASLGSLSALELQQQIKYYNNLKCGKTLDIIRLNTHQGRNRCSLRVIKPRQTSEMLHILKVFQPGFKWYFKRTLFEICLFDRKHKVCFKSCKHVAFCQQKENQHKLS